MSFPEFGVYLTPTEFLEEYEDERSLEELIRISKNTKERCITCGQPIWRFADCGLCFTCTTGQTDASDDIELVEE